MELNMNSTAYTMCMENYRLMSLDQPREDRLHYQQYAMEATTKSAKTSGYMLSKLYRSIIGRSGVNFGKVPESKGDITKYMRYELICECLDTLDRMLKQYQVEELQLAHKLIDTLVVLRKDFEYGYKTGNEFLKTTYCTMVFALHQIINICIVIYTDHLIANREGKPYKSTIDSQNLIVVKNIKDFLRMYESGEWAHIMKGITRDSRELMGEFGQFADSDIGKAAHFIISAASQGGIAYGAVKGVSRLKSVYNDVDSAVKKAAAVADAGGNPEEILNGIGKASKAFYDTVNRGREFMFNPVNMRKVQGTFTTKGKIVIIIVAIIAALFIIRNLISLFYKGAYGIRDVINHEEAFLKAHAEAEKENGNNFAYAFQSKFLNALIGLRDLIDRRIIKDDATGKKEIAKENREDFSYNNLRTIASAADTPDTSEPSDGSGSDFELV